jgi:hypothetical protein
MGGVQVSENLVDANLANALIAVGTFEINGVQFDYDTGTDSLSGLISEINQSKAGVTAFYDPLEDKLVLSQDDSGSTAIQLDDVVGDFLAQMNLLAATQETGDNAHGCHAGVGQRRGAARLYVRRRGGGGVCREVQRDAVTD